MILFNAALVEAYWERPRARLLGRQPGEGWEPLSEQRSAGQPGYLGESPLHLHPHRAPITATQPTDIPLTGIRATGSRAMDIRATRDTPLTPVPQVMDTQATWDTPLTPVLRAMDTQATRNAPVTPVPRLLDTRTARPILPTPVPVTEIPWLAISATVLRRIGRLEPSTVSSLLAEFRPEIHPQSSTPLVAVRTNGSVKRIPRRRDRQHSIAASGRGLTAHHIPASAHSPWREARAGLILSCNPSNRVSGRLPAIRSLD